MSVIKCFCRLLSYDLCHQLNIDRTYDLKGSLVGREATESERQAGGVLKDADLITDGVHFYLVRINKTLPVHVGLFSPPPACMQCMLTTLLLIQHHPIPCLLHIVILCLCG